MSRKYPKPTGGGWMFELRRRIRNWRNRPR